ncbi:glycosyltransferase [Candidatus Peregrinibacteria bacterium]|nr:glycosyltransferase [Candidatus Scalindua sp.]MBT7930234.1 glycosyltransferase [Candidatus Peregrinibacteria bacterium]
MYPEITFTITTYKRLDMFKRTMKSFMRKCMDKELITRWILVDDGSPQEELDEIKELYPIFEIVQNTVDRRGQPVSLNKIIDMVETEWFFHCEDDWIFLIPFFIGNLFDIANDDRRIKNVIMRNKRGNIQYGKEGNLMYNLHRYDPVMEPPLVKDYSPCILDCDSNWFGYSWNPGLHHIPTLKIIGKLDEGHSNISRKWDRAHALRYLELGFKRANPVDKIYIDHIGEGKSEYTH